MLKVITYGTFDILHWGHIRLLERAKSLGVHLTVVLSTDDFNLLKHKESYHSYEHRKYILESIKYVDKVIPEESWGQKIDDIINENINIFVMGDDWEGKFDYLNEYCKVIYLPRTDLISTSKIREDLKL